jgi:hypothetical protein
MRESDELEIRTNLLATSSEQESVVLEECP